MALHTGKPLSDRCRRCGEAGPVVHFGVANLATMEGDGFSLCETCNDVLWTWFDDEVAVLMRGVVIESHKRRFFDA